ncbi:hypothetical protein ISE44_34280, partial [Pseudomonas aeruginosa]|nr:hypothetical protein [Pseudomonas aeruginosa]MBX5903700.1 hypothetical protein [Pseudomonas aeruginosa]
PAYSASAKVICFIIEKLGDWCPGILPNQEVFFRISLERLRLSTTKSLIERRDVIVVASVSSIYGLGDPDAYRALQIALSPGVKLRKS